MAYVRERKPARKAVVYPETDGKPMAESDLHRIAMQRAIETLTRRFGAEARVYVSGSNLVYFEEGSPRKSVSPDCYVVRGVPKGPRRVYLLWQEGRAPSFVLEVTSRSTRREDREKKKKLYRTLGVHDYFLFDPEGEWIPERLRGFSLENGRYRPVERDPAGRLRARSLGLSLGAEHEDLVFFDQATGERLLSPDERAAAAEANAIAERERANAAEARARELEAELVQRRSGRRRGGR